jgi:hypothetical protein
MDRLPRRVDETSSHQSFSMLVVESWSVSVDLDDVDAEFGHVGESLL